MEKKKVAYIVPDSPISPMGGMGVQSRYVMDGLKDDYDITFFGPDVDGHMMKGAMDGLGVSDLTTPHYAGKSPEEYSFKDQSLYYGNPMYQTMLTQPRIVSTVINYYNKMGGKPDLIHSNDWSTSIASYELSKFYKIPNAMQWHLIFSDMAHTLNRVIKDSKITPEATQIMDQVEVIERALMKKAYCNIFVSKAMAVSFGLRYDKLMKSKIYHNGIPMDEFKDLKKVKFPDQKRGEFKLLYCGRIANMKGILPLLKAVQDQKFHKKVKLYCLSGRKGSDTPATYWFEDAVNTGAITWIGEIQGKERFDFMHSADAMIVPSLYEPFGIVPLEALACGTPLISSFEGGMSEFLTEKCAVKCEVSPEGIVDAVEKVRKMGRRQKKKMILEGLKVAKSYDWPNRIPDMKKIWDDCINSHEEWTKHDKNN